MTNVSAAERMAANRPISDAEDIHQMKLQIMQARREAEQAAAQQAAAKNTTKTVSASTKKALSDYQDKAQSHYNKWHAKNGGNGKTEAAEMADWKQVWEDSEEGKKAKKALEPHLVEYSQAVQDEMRLAAAANGGDPNAIAKKRDEIAKRDHDGSWADTVMDGMVTGLSVSVAAESPELRSAILDTDGALAERNAAAADLKSLQDAKAAALGTAHNRWLRQEYSEGYDVQIKAAQERLARAEAALKTATEHELSLDLTGEVLNGAKANLDSTKTLPPQLRRIERADAQAWLNAAQSQYDAAVDGVFDPEKYTSDQVNAAVQRVLGRHTDLVSDPFALMHLYLTGEALKIKPTIDSTLAALDPNDPRLPDWLKTLAADEKTKVDAVFIIMLAQSTVPVTDAEKAAAANDPLWALSKYVPANTAETALAKTDPMTFAMLKYLGGSLDPSKFGDFTDIAQRNLARKQVEDLATAALATTPGQLKMQTLQILTMAIVDVRADYVQSMVTAILAGQSAEDGVK